MIGNSAFSGCLALKAVTLPEGIKELQTFAFGFCTGLETIHLPHSLQTIATDALYFSGSVTAYCYENTPAETFCKKSSGFTYVVLPVLADLNEDGARSVADAILLARCVTELAENAPSIPALSAADRDLDGCLTLLDVISYLEALTVLSQYT